MTQQEENRLSNQPTSGTTGFEYLIENSGCMYIVVAKAKKFAVIDYFIAFFCKLLSIIEPLKEVSNGCGWIPMRSHAIEICCEVGGGDGSVISVKTSKKIKWLTLTKLGDAMFESGHVFFWTLVSDHGDKNNAKFTVGGEFFFVVFVEAYNFSGFRSCDGGIYRSGSGVYGWRYHMPS